MLETLIGQSASARQRVGGFVIFDAELSLAAVAYEGVLRFSSEGV